MESKSSADSLLSYTHATRQDGVKFSACLPLDICKKKKQKKKKRNNNNKQTKLKKIAVYIVAWINLS